MPIPMAIARFNRRVTNPLTSTFAGRAPGFGILVHRGRRSGRTYRTPLSVFRSEDGFVILLTYGRNVDWAKNVIAAGAATLVYRGRELPLTRPRFLTEAEGMAAIPGAVRVVARLLGASDVLALDSGMPG